MRTRHIFVIWSCSKLRVRFPASKTGLFPSSFPTDRSKVVLLLQFFVCRSMSSSVAFVLS